MSLISEPSASIHHLTCDNHCRNRNVEKTDNNVTLHTKVCTVSPVIQCKNMAVYCPKSIGWASPDTPSLWKHVSSYFDSAKSYGGRYIVALGRCSLNNAPDACDKNSVGGGARLEVC